ncbi:MAG: hypothetical protein WC761_00665 [Candidatus Paceibacterota bacterium]
MASFNEYEGLTGFEFFPFDDGGNDNLQIQIAISGQSGSGYDTFGFDSFRQGVEITNSRQLYQSNQPKLWSGNLNHYTRMSVYGQARSWTEYENSKIHDDQVVPFNVLQYITDPDHYPVPIYFNDGPQSEEECIIEPFTIPFRKSPEEGAFPPRRPKGSLEDGNGFDSLLGATNRITQFIEYAAPLTARYFLDGGQEYIGDGALADDIIVEGFVPYIVRLGDPFNDTKDEEIVNQIDTSTDATFIAALKALKIELDEDIRETYTQKSSTAGYSTYGPEQARYGTDSIAFGGLLRGS